MPCYDYSDVYYNMVHDVETPAERTGKFVALLHGSDVHIGFSPIELSKFHANIVDRICKSLGETGTYDKPKENFTPRSDHVRVLGGGKWRIDESKDQLELWGYSLAYGPIDFDMIVAQLKIDWPFNCAMLKVILPTG